MLEEFREESGCHHTEGMMKVKDYFKHVPAGV